MTRHDLHQLQDVHIYPCLTITLPTHRTSPDNKQDPIRVKNLVTVLAKGGQVVFVEDGELAFHKRIALILRY